MLLSLAAAAYASDTVRCPARVTHMKVERGAYSPQPGAVYGLANFDADMVARGKAEPLCFQRTTEIHMGEVFVSGESLTHMFDKKLSQSGDSKLSDVKLETRDDNTVRLTGKMKKKISMSFTIEGPVSTDGRNLILQAKKIDAAKLPVKWLMGMLGQNLAKMLGSETISGVVARDNTLIFQPAQIAHVDGHIQRLQITSKGMELTFGEARQNAKLRKQ